MKRVCLVFAIFLLSCNPIENTPELVDRLRAFGVSTQKAAYSTDAAETDIELTFYLVSNRQTDLLVEELEVEVGQLIVQDWEIKEPDDFSRLRIFEVIVSAKLPKLEELQFSEADDTASVPYAMLFSQDGEQERVRGRIKIYRPSDPRLGQEKPVIKIVNPQNAEQLSGSSVMLKAKLEDISDQSYRISWLVSDGKIAKPRAIETEWEEFSANSQTIIVTFRGLDSWNFAYDVVDIIR